MPTPYIEKMAKKHGMSVGQAEKVWDRAKKASSDPANFAIITTIFKNMIGEEASAQETAAVDTHNLAAIFNRAAYPKYQGFTAQGGTHSPVRLDRLGKKFADDLAAHICDRKGWKLKDPELDLFELSYSSKHPDNASKLGYLTLEATVTADGKAKTLTETIRVKGFFQDKLIQYLDLFDPAKVAKLGNYTKAEVVECGNISVDIDHEGGRDPKAESLSIKLTKTKGTPYSYLATGTKANLKKYLIYHYDGEEDAKELHPEVFK